MSDGLTFRKYQLEAIGRIFEITGVEPAGPETEQVVAHCRSHRAGKNGDHGRSGSALAGGPSDDDFAPF